MYFIFRKLDELKEEVKNSIDDGEPLSDAQKSGGITRLPSPTHRMEDGEKLRIPKPVIYVTNYPKVPRVSIFHVILRYGIHLQLKILCYNDFLKFTYILISK